MINQTVYDDALIHQISIIIHSFFMISIVYPQSYPQAVDNLYPSNTCIYSRSIAVTISRYRINPSFIPFLSFRSGRFKVMSSDFQY